MTAQYVQHPPTPAEIEETIRAHFAAHNEHPWEQVGRCVYCGPCGVRLFQGRFDTTKHEVYVRPRKPTKADEMRARWGMQ